MRSFSLMVGARRFMMRPNQAFSSALTAPDHVAPNAMGSIKSFPMCLRMRSQFRCIQTVFGAQAEYKCHNTYLLYIVVTTA